LPLLFRNPLTLNLFSFRLPPLLFYDPLAFDPLSFFDSV
jgi:hypothetical protein